MLRKYGRVLSGGSQKECGKAGPVSSSIRDAGPAPTDSLAGCFKLVQFYTTPSTAVRRLRAACAPRPKLKDRLFVYISHERPRRAPARSITVMPNENDTNVVDPRVGDDNLRATNEHVVGSYSHQLRKDFGTTSVRTRDIERAALKKDERIYIEFEQDDLRNPFNFSRRCTISLFIRRTS
jgi:hypothetical protein